MNNHRMDATVSADRRKWLRGVAWVFELEFGLLFILLLAIYFTRITQPTIRGEESRRAQVAVEMIQSGEWIVPRLQGIPFLSRPPLQNWAIAVVGKMRGMVDEVAVRMPSILATVLIACLVYGYARSFLSPTGALVAAAGYATMGQVLELGRLGETEALFTLFVSGSLLVWHWADSKGWPKVATWSLAYSLVALGTLTKGPQAPIYFAATISLYLLLRQRWRELFSWSHLIGVLTFLGIWSAWQIPFLYELGWAEVEHIYVSDVTFRFEDSRFLNFVIHLFRFPVEVLLGCLLPWSPLLVALLFRDFWKSLGPASDHVLFLTCCIAVTFPTCWLVPGAVGRYYMPLYPCMALLVGLVAERCWLSDGRRDWQKAWSRFLVVTAGLMVGVAVSVFGISYFGDGVSAASQALISKVAQPPGFAAAYLAICALLAIIAFRSRRATDDVQRRAGTLAVSAFLGLTYVGLFLNCLEKSSNNTREQVVDMKAKLPEGTRLFSLGKADHQFAFHFREPITLQPWPESQEELPSDFSYFCFKPEQQERPLPFVWEQVAIVTCDRNRKRHPEHKVIVARRLPGRVVTNQSNHGRR